MVRFVPIVMLGLVACHVIRGGPVAAALKRGEYWS